MRWVRARVGREAERRRPANPLPSQAVDWAAHPAEMILAETQTGKASSMFKGRNG